MTYQGDYDPAAFDQADPLTWPTSVGYEPGDWWYLTGPGTINGHVVDVGWRLFPRGTGRLYGELDYGGGVYGGPVPDPPWVVDDPNRVTWVAAPWSDVPAWQRPPAPYAGCPFGDTGWRIAVEVLTIVDGARLYGDLAFGDGVYGDTVNPATDWVDVTHTTYGVEVDRGGTDAAPLIPVDEATVQLLDVDTGWFPLLVAPDTDDGIVRSPGVHSPLRVSLIDPAGDPHPLYTGRIESLTDVADTPTRDVMIESYGMAADLVTTIGRLARVEETVAARLDYLVAAAGYSWGTTSTTSTTVLRRIDPSTDRQIRTEVDRAALSAGLQTRTDTLGVLAWWPWPPEPSVDVVEVSDRLHGPPLAAIAVTVIGDRGELLNRVSVASEAVQGSPELTAIAIDSPSAGRFGWSSQSLGFPLSGLSARQADLDQLAADTRDRFGRIVNRVTQITVDTLTDPRWLSTLADLDHGQQIAVTLTKPTERAYRAIVVGTRYRITPGRIVADLFLSTIDPTL